MNKIKIHEWFNTILIGVVIILGLVGGNSQPANTLGGSSDSGWNATGDGCIAVDGTCILDSSGNLSVSGTTTIAHSPDGFVLWDDVTVGTTTTVVRGTVTNTGSPLMCDGDSLFVYTSSPSTYVPSFKYAVGTSTNATYSANLIASTTVATSTAAATTVNGPVTWPFELANGSSITLSIGDAVSNASSTYYGNWGLQFGVHCWTLGS